MSWKGLGNTGHTRQDNIIVNGGEDLQKISYADLDMLGDRRKQKVLHQPLILLWLQGGTEMKLDAHIGRQRKTQLEQPRLRSHFLPHNMNHSSQTVSLIQSYEDWKRKRRRKRKRKLRCPVRPETLIHVSCSCAACLGCQPPYQVVIVWLWGKETTGEGTAIGASNAGTFLLSSRRSALYKFFVNSEELGILQSYLVDQGVLIGYIITKANHIHIGVSGGQSWAGLLVPVLTLLHNVLR